MEYFTRASLVIPVRSREGVRGSTSSMSSGGEADELVS